MLVKSLNGISNYGFLRGARGPKIHKVTSRFRMLIIKSKVPEDVFMVIELQPGYLNGGPRTIKYHEAFGNL